MKTEQAVLASQTRLMLSQAQALTSDQGKDWLGNLLNKHGLEPTVQAWLEDAGLRMVEYSTRSDVCAVDAGQALVSWQSGPDCGHARGTLSTLRLGSCWTLVLVPSERKSGRHVCPCLPAPSAASSCRRPWLLWQFYRTVSLPGEVERPSVTV